MNGSTAFDQVAAYVESRRTNRVPEGLLEAVLARVDETPQRSAWRIAEWWLPGGASNVARIRNTAALIAILALVILLAIAMLVAVGASHRLPPPFGPARPGLIAFDLAGDLYVANPDGAGRTRLTSGPDTDYGATWSPDGTRIAFESRGADSTIAVIVMRSDGSEPLTLMNHLADASELSWSPDSRRVAWSGSAPGPGFSHLFVADVNRSGLLELGGPQLVGEAPVWSPDGTEIVFRRKFPCITGKGAVQPTYCGAAARTDALWLISSGSNLHELTATTGSGQALWNTAWAPDGKRLAFLAAGNGGRFDVFVINADGTGERNVSTSPENEFWPSWSPDGKRIAFPRMSPTEFNQGVFVIVDPDGSHPVLLDGPPVNSNTPVWSPDGLRLMGYAKSPSLDTNQAIALFDPSGRVPPIIIAEDAFTGASWQRLAP